MSNKVTLKEWMRAVRAIHETGGPSTDSLNLHGVSFRAFETLLSMLAYRSGCIINDSTAPKEDIKLEWHIPSAPGTTGQALGLVRVLEPPSSLRRGAARFISDRNNGNDTSWLFHTCIKASASPTDQAPSWATTACMSLLRSTATGKQAALVLDVAQHEPRRRFEERLLRICTALSHNDGGAAPLVIGIKLWCQEGSASNGRMQAIVIRPNPKEPVVEWQERIEFGVCTSTGLMGERGPHSGVYGPGASVIEEFVGGDKVLHIDLFNLQQELLKLWPSCLPPVSPYRR